MKKFAPWFMLLALLSFSFAAFAQHSDSISPNSPSIHAVSSGALHGNAQRSGFSPFLRVGPQAIPVDASESGVGSNYGLFTCQIVNLSPGTTCYDPYQMRHAYGIDTLVNAGFDGKGKTIVIVDAFQSPNIVAELNSFDSFYGLPSLNGLGAPQSSSLGTFTQVAPDGLTPFLVGNNNMAGWAEEISLDVLWAHAIAPGANITLVLAKSNNDDDILSATKYAVDNNLGDVISQSFGENESCVDPSTMAQQHQIFADATAKNVTIFASAGDSGAAQGSCNGKSLVKAVSSPATDPLVTAVGGTELHAARYCLLSRGCDPASIPAPPAPGTYQGEIVWNESASGIGATGGGLSVVFNEPFYQRGILHDGKLRGATDVSYNAAVLHGVLTFLNIPGVTSPAGAFFLFGGTSAGSPQWAAITAIADQHAGHNLGFINTALYHIAQDQAAYSTSFLDVTSGDNSFAGITGFSAGPGWDPATGLGSPAANQLVSALELQVSAGDGTAAIAVSNPHSNSKPDANGHVAPH
jgi:subtilase family serine protease